MSVGADVIAKIGGAAAGLVALWGAIKYLPKLIDTARISHELTAALEDSRNSASAARSYRLAAEGYRQRIDALIEQTKAAGERADAATERADTAIIYIVDVINFVKSGRPFEEMPPIPELLESWIYEQMHKRAVESRAEAAKSHRPFHRAPEEGEEA